MKPWIIMPVVNGWPMTEQAIYDCLGQTVEPNLLVVCQGVDSALRDHLERMAEKFPDRIFCWFFDPPLLSLSGVWNRGLSFIWETGAKEALVVNNDIRLAPGTYAQLDVVLHATKALFVSAVGVTQDQFSMDVAVTLDFANLAKGGPDFSCFLISRAGHWKYPFDERFIPAFCEDCSTHREYMLGGDGARIFSVNVPYLHYASQTLKTSTPERRAALERQIGGARAHYERCWGGPPNQERYMIKGDPKSARDGVTNPELQAEVLGRAASRVRAGGGESNATPDSTAPC